VCVCVCVHFYSCLFGDQVLFPTLWGHLWLVRSSLSEPGFGSWDCIMSTHVLTKIEAQVCVCVCVFEREREWERERTPCFIFNIQTCFMQQNCSHPITLLILQFRDSKWVFSLFSVLKYHAEIFLVFLFKTFHAACFHVGRSTVLLLCIVCVWLFYANFLLFWFALISLDVSLLCFLLIL